MILKEVSQWLRPQFSYFVVNKQPDFEMGNIILRQLRGSEAFALFICTSGLEFETYQHRLKEQGDMVRVFIADALGSVIAEKCADQMEKALQESIDKLGWKHTNRFSPGYCGWHVSQQQLLFPLFQGHTCGVKLTDSSLMVPIKSVSGIIGLGEKVRKLEYTCGLCDFKQCYKRKKKA
jgi:cobalamin-dependent methionine synthase I